MILRRQVKAADVILNVVKNPVVCRQPLDTTRCFALLSMTSDL